MFNNLFPPVKSGSSHFTHTLSKMLAARGHEVTVVAARVEGAPAHEQLDGLDIYRLSCLMLPQLEIAHGFKYLSYTFFPWNLRQLAELCQRKRFDVLHQHGQIFDTALSSRYLAGKFHIPLVTTIHTPVRHTVPFYMSILKFLDKTIVKHLIIKRAQLLIAPDQTVVDNVNERYQHEWVLEVPYGVDQFDIRPEYATEIREKYKIGDRPVILSLGHVHNLRDRCDLISAMPEIIKQVPDVHLLIVGDIYTQRPIELTQSLGLKSHVTFTGGIPHEEIGKYLSAATIEAHWFGGQPALGIAAMEAMAVGKPVVASIGADDLGKGVLRPGENIMLIDCGSLPNIADTIVQLLRDPNLRQRIGENGRKMIEEHFSWTSVTERMEAAYQQLIERYHRSA
ncbi:MAG: glycosyltransferase family 4 protein [Acidobacteriota bacterium]